uniref:Uncharacterized protein n=1 Tax=Panagrolaimus davidi TaxID=227884 RepID=A0A914QVS1_9BILA
MPSQTALQGLQPIPAQISATNAPVNVETQTNIPDPFTTPHAPRIITSKNTATRTPRKPRAKPIYDEASGQKDSRKRRADKNQNVNDRIIGLSNHLMGNRDKFNLNEKGQIVDEKTGKAIPGSNQLDVAEYIVKGSTSAATPKGYKKINKILDADAEVKRFKVTNWAK